MRDQNNSNRTGSRSANSTNRGQQNSKQARPKHEDYKSPRYSESDGSYEEFINDHSQGDGSHSPWDSYNNHDDSDYDSGRKASSRNKRSASDHSEKNYPSKQHSEGSGSHKSTSWGNTRKPNYETLENSGKGGSNPDYQGLNSHPRHEFDGNLHPKHQFDSVFEDESAIHKKRKSYKGIGPKNYRRSDERISDDINECLSDHHDINAAEISVSVKNGKVTLSGTVDDKWMSYTAEDLIENFTGVEEVENNIKSLKNKKSSNKKKKPTSSDERKAAEEL